MEYCWKGQRGSILLKFEYDTYPQASTLVNLFFDPLKGLTVANIFVTLEG